MQTLLDNQTKGISKLSTYKVGALFMEPGTGKTRTAYELIKSVPDIDFVLWLTPFQTKNNLIQEIAKCGGFNSNLIVCGIESLSNSDRIYLELYNRIGNAIKPFIVCDETLKIKNHDAIRTQRILILSTFAEYKLILNGTPISKNLLDLWSQFEFLSPIILNMGIAEFKNTFCEYTIMTKRIGNKKIVREWINKYHNVDYLYSLIKHYVYECDLSLEVNKQYININYAIEPELKEQYAFLKGKYLHDEMLQAKNNNIFLEMTQKMQHSYCLTPDKFTAVKHILRSNNPNKVLIFCKYLDSEAELKRKFPNIAVHTFGKSAFGLNLQDYNVLVKFDKTWDFAQITQTDYRIFRTGQKEDCFFYDLTGDVPLENLINNNIDKKQDLLQYLKGLTIKELKEVL